MFGVFKLHALRHKCDVSSVSRHQVVVRTCISFFWNRVRKTSESANAFLRASLMALDKRNNLYRVILAGKFAN